MNKVEKLVFIGTDCNYPLSLFFMIFQEKGIVLSFIKLTTYRKYVKKKPSIKKTQLSDRFSYVAAPQGIFACHLTMCYCDSGYEAGVSSFMKPTNLE